MSFEQAFQKVLELEGGLTLHKNTTEASETYAGIYRKAHPSWEGWQYIDRGLKPPLELVKEFYYENFYKPIEIIPNETVRDLLFEFGVNASLRTAIKLMQRVIGAKPDGVIGKETLQKLNEYLSDKTEEDFVKDYTLTRISFYTNLANKNPKRYGIYLRGWINRALKTLEEVA
ncbi:putative peptidoglycan-binding domain-containing protein [Persephonella sp.]